LNVSGVKRKSVARARFYSSIADTHIRATQSLACPIADVTVRHIPHNRAAARRIQSEYAEPGEDLSKKDALEITKDLFFKSVLLVEPMKLCGCQPNTNQAFRLRLMQLRFSRISPLKRTGTGPANEPALPIHTKAAIRNSTHLQLLVRLPGRVRIRIGHNPPTPVRNASLPPRVPNRKEVVSRFRTSAWLICLLLCTVISTGVWADTGILKIHNGYFWDPVANEYFIPRGIAYQTWNPPVGANQSFEQLDYDLVEFKKLHANSVRCEFVWNQIETSPGVFDWSKPDHLVAKAEELGLRLFVLIGFQYAPNWFPDEWKAINAQGDRSLILNYEHPEARRANTNYIYQAAHRYRNSPAIGGWILGNEYAYFDLWESAHHLLGFDEFSQSSFRMYLSSLYGADIAALNSIWETSFAGFESVEMPRIYPSTRDGPGYHDLIQWRKQSIGDFVAQAAIAAKAADPNHLLSYSMVGGIFGESDKLYTCEDARTIVARCRLAGAPLDFWSINNYAIATLNTELRSGDFGIAHHRAESGLPVMISETGDTSTEVLYNDVSGRQPKAVVGQMWEALMSGAIGTHIFTWNDRDFYSGNNSPRERGFGVVNQDRTAKTNGVYARVLEMFRRMENASLHHLLPGSATPPPDIQMFWTASSDMGWPRANHENFRIWSALKRLGYQVRLIGDEEFENGAYTNAAALLLSRSYQMNPHHLEIIQNQVITSGVNVHANGDLPGEFSAYHQWNLNWASFMETVFGLNVDNASAGLDAGAISFDAGADLKRLDFIGRSNLGPFSPAYREHLKTWKISHGIRPVSGTTIVAHTGVNGALSGNPVPALHVKDLGSAKSAINTFALGDSYHDQATPLKAWDTRYDWLRAIYRNHFGIQPSLDLSGPGARYVTLDYRICWNGSVLISLFNDYTNNASLTLTATSLIQGMKVEDLTRGGIIATNASGSIQLNLAADEYRLLYVYPGGPAEDDSLVNPSTQKLWFESAPNAVWPNTSGYPVTIGHDLSLEGVTLVVTLEQLLASNKVRGKSATASVAGKGLSTVNVSVLDADLNDPDYVSSSRGGQFVWHASLEKSGVRISEAFLPVRLLWGVRPDALPATVTPGHTYPIALNWEELPSYAPNEIPMPLSRADLWDSLHSNSQHYAIRFDLKSAGQVVASAESVTRIGTSSNTFMITVPQNATEPFTWSASVRPATNVLSHDVQDSFEGRPLGALTALLELDPQAASPLAPWESYHYPTNGAQQWFDEGAQLAASDGSQSPFLVVSNPPPPFGYSGFGIRRIFSRTWALPSDWNRWTDYTFGCDIRLSEYRRCIIELQIKNDDPAGTGKWIQYSEEYRPGSNGWHSISAPLTSFARPAWSFATFDWSNISELVINIQMLESNATYVTSFDNIRFNGPEVGAGSGSPVAIYESSNDSRGAIVDTDRDGIPDAFETRSGVYQTPTSTGTDPNNPDSDGDGQSDGSELIAGTDPTRTDDVLMIRTLRRSSDGTTVLGWNARPGRVYQIYYSDDSPAAGGYIRLEALGPVISDASGNLEVTDLSAPNSAVRFYRLGVELP
jgi:hypothetical protein